MDECSNCGNQIDDDVEICPYCGYRFTDDELTCSHCGNPISMNTVICPHCGFKAEDSDKNLILAVLLTVIFPGIGHLYIGQTTKAIIFIVLAALSYVLMIFLIGFVTYFIILIWAVLNVIRSTNFLNRGIYVEDKLF